VSIFKQLGIETRRWDDLGKFMLVSGAKLGKPEILFKKLEQKEIEALHEKYSGKQAVEPRFSDFDLEVGEITEVQKHPNAEKLYVEKVKLSDGVRQIVSGLAKHYLPEQLLGKKVVIVKNLKPAVLRGTLSEGMLLAAENKEGLVEVLSPKKSKVGEKVKLSDEEPKPKKEITVDDFFKVKIEVEKGIVLCEGKAVVTDSEELKTENVIDGKVG
jgi:methionyl-tRNA synthetase